MSRTPGIRVRHRASCRANADGRCNCAPTYEASVGGGKQGQKIRESFPTLAAAKAWQTEARHAVHRGQLHAGSTMTIREAADDLIDGMKSGRLRTRAGAVYKPSVMRVTRSLIAVGVSGTMNAIVWAS